MIIKLNKEEIKDLGLNEFYKVAATVAGLETEFGMFDCRKINVSKKIQDLWYEMYKEKGMNPTEITMMLLMCGPKVDPDLTGYTADVDKAFVSLDYPYTLINQKVLDYYDVDSAEKLPEDVKKINYKNDPICIVSDDSDKGMYYFRLTWSSEYCEEEGMMYMDYTIYDENYKDYDGGLISVPERIDNLVDALDYASRVDDDIDQKLALRYKWELIDEDAITSICEG